MPRKLVGIVRIEYEPKGMRGWQARIYRGSRQERKMYSKWFADAQFGGKRAALEAATKWREKWANKDDKTLSKARRDAKL